MVLSNNDLIVCRCEEVTLGDIERAKENGLNTSQEIKMATRLGMGMCQGKICRCLIDALFPCSGEELLHQPSTLTIHRPVRPVSLGHIAVKEDL